MGDITNGFRTTYRDYVTEGVPASGPNDPSKAEIRALGLPIEAGIAAAAIANNLPAASALIAPVLSSAQASQAAAENSVTVLYQALYAIPQSVAAQLDAAVANATSDAEDARDAAQLAADTALAIGRFFPSQSAGEAASATDQYFSHPDGSGGLIFRRKTAGGSVVIAQAATAARVAAIEGKIERTLPLIRVPAPTSSVTAAAGGSGPLNGTYVWRVTFVSPAGETEASIASNTLTLGGKTANLTNIPVSNDSTVTARRIYRTTGSEPASELGKLVATIPNNTATTFTDDVSDAALGSRTPWFNTTGGGITLNGSSYLGTGFSTRFGVQSQPSGTNYAVTTFGSNTMPVSERVLRSEAFGVDAGQALVSGSGVTFIGTHAGGSLTDASDTIVMGYGTFQTATKSTAVVAIGRAALANISSEVSGFVAVGAYAAQLATGGGAGVFVGTSAGYGAGSGVGCTVVGHEAGTNIGNAFFCTYMGLQAGRGTGNGNTGIGYGALGGQTSGAGNVAIGQGAGSAITTGANNTFIGNNAGSGSGQKVDANTSTAIGQGAMTDKDQQVVIGTADTQFVKMAGVEFTKAQIAKLLALASAS